MTNRLTPEALDALLAEHHSCCGEAPTCEKPHCMATYCNSNWPCALYLLASEVRDARPFEHCWASELEAARKVVAEIMGWRAKGWHAGCQCRLCTAVAEYLRVMEEQR